MNLNGASFILANLCQAKLIQANLSGADLSGANLSLAALIGANLSRERLYQADLREAVLNGANLIWANLSGAGLHEAFLSETIFGNGDLKDTIGLDECNYSGPSTVNFRTLSRSKNLPVSFLRGCGLPDNLIDYLPCAVTRPSLFLFHQLFDQRSVVCRGAPCRLAERGRSVLVCAPHDLPIGAKTWDAIDQAIRLRDKLLVVLSRASLDSDWVEDEVTKAYAEERARKEEGPRAPADRRPWYRGTSVLRFRPVWPQLRTACPTERAESSGETSMNDGQRHPLVSSISRGVYHLALCVRLSPHRLHLAAPARHHRA